MWFYLLTRVESWKQDQSSVSVGRQVALELKDLKSTFFYSIFSIFKIHLINAQFLLWLLIMYCIEKFYCRFIADLTLALGFEVEDVLVSGPAILTGSGVTSCL